MAIDDSISAIKTLNDSEEPSQLVPYKEPAFVTLSAIFSCIAAASSGEGAIAAAIASGFLAVAASIISSAAVRRVKEFVSDLYEEFPRRGVTAEQVEECFKASEKVEELLAEAVLRASEAKSRERVRRIARLLTTIILSTEEIQIEEARVMLEIAGSLFDSDAFVLGRMYEQQSTVVKKRDGHPELNEITESWRKLRKDHAEFRSGPINSSCARLQAHGLIIRVEPGTGQFDLQTYMYAITDFGVRFCTWCVGEIN
jgi:hypothetical protein